MELVGREEQLGLLHDALSEAESRGATILIRGAPGIGKTALLAAAQDLAESMGFQVLRAVGVEAESDIPFAGLQQLLRPLSLVPAGGAPQRLALAAALGHAEGDVPDVFLVGLAALDLIADAAAAAPVLILADDLQWLDHATISVLAFVARRVAAEPVVMVGAAREGYHSRLNADEITTTLVLEPLTDDEAAALLADRAPGLRPAVHRRLLAEAAGNPLALTELSRALGQSADPAGTPLPLTERLERAFTDRLATLPARPTE